MATNFHEDLSSSAPAMPSERSTGLVFAGVASIVAVVWREEALATASSIAAALVLISLIVPVILRPLNIAWFRLGMFLNMVISPIVMFALFCIAIVPAGLLMQIGYDPLSRRRKRDAETYWHFIDGDEEDKDMTRQF